MSLRTRIVLAAAYLLLVVVIALEVPLAVNIERRAVSEFESRILGFAGVTSSQVSDSVARVSARQTGTKPEPPHAVPTIDAIIDRYAQATGARVVVVDKLGQVISDSGGEAAVGTPYASPERPELVASLFHGQIKSEVRYSNTLKQNLLVVAVPVTEGGTVVGAVRFSAPLGTIEHHVHEAWLGLAVIGLAVIGMGLGLAWLLATSLARPVRRLRETAERLGAGELDSRASPEGPTEVAALAGSFNRMAAALGASIESQRDFVANASHQLRTPLTGLRLRLEAIEQQGGPAAEEATKSLAEVDRLSALVEDLLDLTRASLRASAGSSVDPSRAAREAVERWTKPAMEVGMHIRLRAHAKGTVWADPKDLAHILDNLIENSIRYCVRGSTITVDALDRDGGVALMVADNGPGISPEERDQVFERFFRGSVGRRSGPGTGLGLAIVRELARRWGGVITLATGPDGTGTRIETEFRAPENPAGGAMSSTNEQPSTSSPPTSAGKAPAESRAAPKASESSGTAPASVGRPPTDS